LTITLGTNTIAAESISTHIKKGSITLQELLKANDDIANSQSSKFVNKAIPGTIIEINNQKFEIRFFSFEDTTGALKKNTKFKDYIANNKLADLKSIKTQPEEGIVFESFSSRITKLNDGVYFGIGLRIVE
jgi:hypothetical protein